MTKVLLIEDNLNIQENTTELLELEGYDVEYTSNGKVGLALALEHLPQIILCDILMPGLNGYEVLKLLKSNPNTKEIPVIFVTANTEKKEIESALNLGVDGYVCKPFDPPQLLSIMTRILESKK